MVLPAHGTLHEQFLPVTRTPETVVDPLEKEWTDALLGLGGNEIKKLLNDRWRCVQDQGFARLARMLEEGMPYSVVETNGIVWLKVHVSKYIAMDTAIQTLALYVRRPFQKDESSQCLERFDLTTNTRHELTTFVMNFGGLRDMEPRHAGSFLEPPHVDTIGTWCEDVDLKEATDFPVFYCAANGDLLGVFPDGRTGWYCTEDLPLGCPVRPFGRNISDTVFKWANCNDYIDGCIYFDDDWSS